MTTRTFAPWVEPIAERFASSRAEVVETARRIPERRWTEESPVAGWTFKDLLGHLSASDNVLYAMGAVIKGEQVDVSRFVEVDGTNERQRQERLNSSVEALIEEMERRTAEGLDLLAQLTPEHADRRQDDFPVSFGEALAGYNHDNEHLAQLRVALEVKA